ncbi:hypothetical protein [Promicromonospora sukumoe]|uniref:hypothetical protein n=1 Tax=Promicromonospora sukumoe TaxID=88382 RepID=UPI00035CBAEB|nr:hypothetical protein [Promicromonospora sukumoe]
MRWYPWTDGDRIALADLALTPADGSPLAEHAAFPLPAEHRGQDTVDDVVATDDGEVVYAARDVVVRLDATGVAVWSHDLGNSGPQRGFACSGLVLSHDGALTWVYAADAMADRGDDDRLLALDSRTGLLLGSAALDSVGHGAELLAHADGSLLVGVAQGQDGGILYLARFDDGALTVLELTGMLDGDRVPCAFSPDGTRLLTCEYAGPDDVAVHSWPDGAVVASFAVEDLAPDQLPGEEPLLEYGAGFLGDDQVFVMVKGDDETEVDFVEWAVPVVIDLVSGTARAVGEPAPSPRDEPVALGDGTWIAVDPRPDRSGPASVRRRFRLSPA